MSGPPKKPPSPLVVEVTLRCTYCTSKQIMRFSTEDGYSQYFQQVGDFVMPFPIASVTARVPKTVGMLWWKREVVIEERRRLSCKNCGMNLREEWRAPITA